MFMFAKEVSAAASIVRSGWSVQVRSPYPGLGLTTTLNQLEALLSEEGHTVFRFRSVLGSDQAAYFALQSAGLGAQAQRLARPAGDLIDELTGALNASTRTVVMIDDVRSIDAESLRVLQIALARAKRPVVEGRALDYLSLRRSGVRWVPTPDAVVTLHALGYVDTASLLHGDLGAPLSSEVVSRIFAKSGGITGLSLAILRGARAAGRIALHDDRWELAAHDLWSATVDAWFDAALTSLSYEQVQVLVSLPAGLDSDAEVVDGLIRSGLLTRSRHTPDAVVPTPPALATYLKAKSVAPDLRQRRTRQDMGSISVMETARVVRLAREKAEARVLQQREVWLAVPTPANALPYLTTLSSSPRNDRAIQEVFDRTQLSMANNADDVLDFVLYDVLREDRGTSPRAASIVKDFVSTDPQWAHVFQILSYFRKNRSVPAGEVSAARSEAAVDPISTVIVALDAYAQLGEGRTSRVLRDLRVPTFPMHSAARFQTFVDPLVRLVQGRLPEAFSVSQTDLLQAIESADYRQIMIHSYVCAMVSTFNGDRSRALAFIDQALAFGAPGGGTTSLYRALLFLGSFLHAGAGSENVARAFLDEARSFETSTPPLPFMQAALAEALEAYIDGDIATAVAISREVSADIATEGELFAAVATLEFTLSIRPEIQTLDALTQCRTLPSGRVLPTPDWVHVVAATFASDEAFSRAVSGISTWVRNPLLEPALRERLQQDAGWHPGTRERVERFLTAGGTDSSATPTVIRGATTAPGMLTRREREVSLLAARLSNREIAAQLGVSVRTVESHVRNAMKKTNTRHRSALTISAER